MEEVGPRYGSLVRSGAGDKTVGEARIELRMSGRDDANKRIGRAYARDERLAATISFEMMAQERGIAVIDFAQPANGRAGIGEGFGSDHLRG